MSLERFGMIDHTGELVNGILVERLDNRRHKRYGVRCTKCLTSWTVPAVQIPYLSCKNSFCGKATTKAAPSLATVRTKETAVRSADSASVREFQRQEQAEQDTGQETAPRRRSLRDGYFQSAPMSTRERESYKQFLAEYEAEQNAPPPGFEEWQRNVTALAREQAKALLIRPDPDFVAYTAEEEEEFFAKYRSEDMVDAANKVNSKRFCKANPDYFPSNSNLDALSKYIFLNCDARGIDLRVITPGILERAYKRLLAYGLLEEPKHVYIEPSPDKEGYLDRLEREGQEAQERAEAEKRDIEERTGIGPDGEPKVYTKRQVDWLMSGDQLRRAFPGRVSRTFTDYFLACDALRGRR